MIDTALSMSPASKGAAKARPSGGAEGGSTDAFSRLHARDREAGRTDAAGATDAPALEAEGEPPFASAADPAKSSRGLAASPGLASKGAAPDPAGKVFVGVSPGAAPRGRAAASDVPGVPAEGSRIWPSAGMTGPAAEGGLASRGLAASAGEARAVAADAAAGTSPAEATATSSTKPATPGSAASGALPSTQAAAAGSDGSQSITGRDGLFAAGGNALAGGAMHGGAFRGEPQASRQAPRFGALFSQAAESRSASEPPPAAALRDANGRARAESLAPAAAPSARESAAEAAGRASSGPLHQEARSTGFPQAPGIAGKPGEAAAGGPVASAAPGSGEFRAGQERPGAPSQGEFRSETPQFSAPGGDSLRGAPSAPSAGAAGPGAATAGGGSNAAPVSLTEAAERLAASIRERPDGVTELRLDPPELGRVRLTLGPGDQALAATVIVERADALDLMRRNADLLQQSLADAGHAQARLSFAQEHGDGPSSQAAGRSDAENEEARELTAADAQGPASHGGLDTRV